MNGESGWAKAQSAVPTKKVREGRFAHASPHAFCLLHFSMDHRVKLGGDGGWRSLV
jgi:hypothetical protein